MFIRREVRSARKSWWELGCYSLDALSKRTCQELNRRGDQYKVWPGETLLAEDSAVHWVFIVLEGELALRRGGRDLRVMRAAETYGALEALEHAHAPGALVARDVSRVLALPVNAFRALAETHADFAFWILRSVARQQSGPAGAQRLVA